MVYTMSIRIKCAICDKQMTYKKFKNKKGNETILIKPCKNKCKEVKNEEES